jgi:ubiquinone biosynthesis protein COQ9
VPEHGFSHTALELGSQKAGYLPASAAIFPHGPFELVRFHLVTRRLALEKEVQFTEREGEEKLGLGGKVKALVLARLRANEALIHRWQEVSFLS